MTAGYDADVFDNLIFRYEEPNGMNRWDSPLFTVPYDDEQPPCEAIWEAIIGSDGNAKIVKPHQATVTVNLSSFFFSRREHISLTVVHDYLGTSHRIRLPIRTRQDITRHSKSHFKLAERPSRRRRWRNFDRERKHHHPPCQSCIVAKAATSTATVHNSEQKACITQEQDPSYFYRIPQR